MWPKGEGALSDEEGSGFSRYTHAERETGEVHSNSSSIKAVVFSRPLYVPETVVRVYRNIVL